MSELLIQHQTAQGLQLMENTSMHSFTLTGPRGSGKETLALEVVRRKLGLSNTASPTTHPFVLLITAENNTIGIERIREIQHFLSLKTTGKTALRRAVIISNAHYMTSEAQNALLKNLEEPPHDTILILTAISPQHLLPTIRSRTRFVEVLPVAEKDAEQFYNSKGFTTDAIDKAFVLSGGYVGLLSALLSQADEHELVHGIKLAKELLTVSPFDRLRRLDELVKNKSALPILFESLQIICKAALANSSAYPKIQVTKLIQALRLVQDAEKAFFKGANTKLLLTNLCVQL